MSKPRNIEVGKYYHVYSRGVNKCLTFIEDDDFRRFQLYIEKCNTKNKVNLSFLHNERESLDEKLVTIFCYCLMPNHFHFVIRENIKDGTSLFFQKILSGYVSYFNKKYKRTGALFGSRFKNKLVDTDIYFKQLIQYIWNNPIKLIRPDYDSIKLLNGEIKLNSKEKLFAKNYTYKQSLLAPTEFGRSE
jgi:putative transposase